MKHKIISLNHSIQTQRLRKTAAAFVSGTQINHFISGRRGWGGTFKSKQSILDTHTDHSHHTDAKKTCIYFYNMKHKIISLNRSMQTQRLLKTAAAFVSSTQINHFIAGMGAPPNNSGQLLTHTHTKTADTIHVQKNLHLFLAHDTQNNKSVWHPNARH